MNELVESGIFGDQVLWGVALWRLAAALVFIFLGFLSRRILRAVFERYVKRSAARTRVMWDNDLVELIPPPAALVANVLFWYAAAAVLALPSEPVNVRLFVFQGLLVALAVALTWVAFRLIDVVARVLDRASAKTETRLDDQLVPLLRKSFKVFLVIVVAISVVQELGYSITSLIASLGIGGLALALAAKDTVANFFGSIVVFTDQPFHVGDWVEFGSVEGVVEEVGMRTTRVRLFDRSLATVPNQTFTSTTIINHSLRPLRRMKMTVGLTYEATPAQMTAFLDGVRALLRDHPALDPDTQVVHFTGFGDSSLDVMIQCFTVSTVWTDFLEAQEDILLKIMHLVEAQGLEIAFPTRTVYLRDEHWNGVVEPASRGVGESGI